MKKGISIHIGLNEVDADYYGDEHRLFGCHKDALDMAFICKNEGYHPILLLDEDANAEKIIRILHTVANDLKQDDSLVITYSGHGTQIPDKNSEEEDLQDESWVLFDRLLIDDEVHLLLSNFKSGVRVLLISDSCHSESITRKLEFMRLVNFSVAKRDGPIIFRTPKDRNFGKLISDQYKEQYNTIYRSIPRNARELIKASVIEIAACQDDQLSADGPENGLFTGKLKEIWNNGLFQGNHSSFVQAITRLLPASEIPNILSYGAFASSFEKEKPFTINSNLNNSRNMKTDPIYDTDYGKPIVTSNGNKTGSTANPDNWSEIKHELEQRFPSFRFPDMQRNFRGNSFGVLPETANDATPLLTSLNINDENFVSRAATGAPIARAFWWGFHIEISSQGIRDFMSVADPISKIIAAIGPVTGPAAPFITIGAAFIAGAFGIIKGLDRGKGVYISMSWFAPGVFIPTTVV